MAPAGTGLCAREPTDWGLQIDKAASQEDLDVSSRASEPAPLPVGARRPRAHAAHTQRVLFAASGFTRSLHALRRAHALAARVYGGELCVLHVAAAAAGGRAGRMRDRAAGGNLLQRVRRFYRRRLDPPPPAERVLSRSGEFAKVVVEAARELGAALIVLPGTDRPSGAAVTQIAHAAGLPVLVAREAAFGGAIVAATDFADGGYRELRHATRLARSLRAELAFLHNVKPLVHASTSALGHCSCTVIEPPVEALEECRGRLQALARYLGARAETVVASRPCADDAILEAASAFGADLVVVGARRQPWLERVFGTALSARIVDRCERSVLVAPLGVDGDAQRAVRPHVNAWS